MFYYNKYTVSLPAHWMTRSNTIPKPDIAIAIAISTCDGCTGRLYALDQCHQYMTIWLWQTASPTVNESVILPAANKYVLSIAMHFYLADLAFLSCRLALCSSHLTLVVYLHTLDIIRFLRLTMVDNTLATYVATTD